MDGYIVVIQCYFDDVIVAGFDGPDGQQEAMAVVSQLTAHVPEHIQDIVGRPITDGQVMSIAVAKMVGGQLAEYEVARDFRSLHSAG
jgi:hypothetical protein